MRCVFDVRDIKTTEDADETDRGALLPSVQTGPGSPPLREKESHRQTLENYVE